VFNRLTVFNDALAARYGAPTSLEDYLRKAQLTQYEAVRAQYEAFGRNFSDTTRPANGVIYWMLNSGWTSLHWQLFDQYLDQNGSYFGAKKANEPLHVQYSYDDRSVVVVNSTNAPVSGLTVRATLFDPGGAELSARTATGLRVAGGGARTTALTLPAPPDAAPGVAPTPTYLARLVLTDAAGREVSRNVYWLSTRPDVIDYAHHEWFYTPTGAYADLTGLAAMAPADLAVTAATTAAGDTTTTTLTLRNPATAGPPAFFVDVHVTGAEGRPVLPIRWNDNQLSLWPGESVDLTATYRTADLAGAAPSVRISGWNVAARTLPAR
jgi:exo-1,4-beta-D-glucosaminidase